MAVQSRRISTEHGISHLPRRLMAHSKLTIQMVTSTITDIIYKIVKNGKMNRLQMFCNTTIVIGIVPWVAKCIQFMSLFGIKCLLIPKYIYLE